MFQRGDIVLIPFPFTDFSATKTRPAVVVNSDIYHTIRSELLLAYVSSQISKANPILDYRLADWSAAGLPQPSFVRPKIAAIEPSLIVYQIGTLSERDLLELDRRLRLAMALTETALIDVVAEVNFINQPAAIVQRLAEHSIKAVARFVALNNPDSSIDNLRKLLVEKTA